jgi:hypothetical protein
MRARLFVPLIGTLAVLFGILTPTSASGYVGWWLQYTSNGNCLEITGGSTANYALLRENACKAAGSSSYSSQLITMTSTGLLKVKHTGKCLDANDGYYVRQLTCNGTPSQSWDPVFLDSEPSGSRPRYLFRSNHTGLCVTGIAAGVSVYQSACNSEDPRQVWVGKITVCETCLQSPQQRTATRAGSPGQVR